MGLLIEPTHMEDENEDQENEKEDERDREECRVEGRCFGSSVAFCVTSFFETQAGGLSMAARGSTVRRSERRMRSWWRQEQASVRMAMITADHHSNRKAAGIEIGVQAGTRLFHNFDRESDDTDPDDLNLAS